MSSGPVGTFPIDQVAYPEPRLSSVNNLHRPWKGISGTAVFAEASDGTIDAPLLVGIVVMDDEVFANRRLHAIPVSAFVHDDSFVQILRENRVGRPRLEVFRPGHSTSPDAARSLGYRAKGERALEGGAYDKAVEYLRARLAEADDPRAHYLLALALLRGRAPRNLRSVRHIIAHLQRAEKMPQADALRMLIEEDYSPASTRGLRPASTHVSQAVSRLTQESAQQILRHVPAPDSCVWQAIRHHAERVIT